MLKVGVSRRSKVTATCNDQMNNMLNTQKSNHQAITVITPEVVTHSRSHNKQHITSTTINVIQHTAHHLFFQCNMAMQSVSMNSKSLENGVYISQCSRFNLNTFFQRFKLQDTEFLQHLQHTS